MPYRYHGMPAVKVKISGAVGCEHVAAFASDRLYVEERIYVE